MSSYIVAKDLHCGDHISWPTKQMYGVTRHHAIVLAWKGGNEMKVIHVKNTDDGSPKYEVREEVIDLGECIAQGKLRRHEYDPKSCYEPYEVVNRAKSKLGRFKYDVLENNCEHFALWCKMCDQKSNQAKVAKGVSSSYVIIQSAKELCVGDHVSWPTETLFGVIRHHAIVLAWKGSNVIKFIHVINREDGSSEYEVRAQVVDIGDAVKQGKLWLYEYEPNKCYEPYEVVRRAESKLGKFQYHALENNCEHFARWCKNNYNRSEQAEAAVGMANPAVGIAAIGALLLGLFRR